MFIFKSVYYQILVYSFLFFQTADLILEGIQSPLVAQRHQLLRERSFGIFEGRHASELNRAAQEAGVPVVDFHPTEGESPKKIQRRANDFCDFLCQSVGNGLLKNTPKMNVSELAQGVNLFMTK